MGHLMQTNHEILASTPAPQMQDATTTYSDEIKMKIFNTVIKEAGSSFAYIGILDNHAKNIKMLERELFLTIDRLRTLYQNKIMLPLLELKHERMQLVNEFVCYIYEKQSRSNHPQERIKWRKSIKEALVTLIANLSNDDNKDAIHEAMMVQHLLRDKLIAIFGDGEQHSESYRAEHEQLVNALNTAPAELWARKPIDCFLEQLKRRHQTLLNDETFQHHIDALTKLNLQIILQSYNTSLKMDMFAEEISHDKAFMNQVSLKTMINNQFTRNLSYTKLNKKGKPETKPRPSMFTRANKVNNSDLSSMTDALWKYLVQSLCAYAVDKTNEEKSLIDAQRAAEKQFAESSSSTSLSPSSSTEEIKRIVKVQSQQHIASVMMDPKDATSKAFFIRTPFAKAVIKALFEDIKVKPLDDESTKQKKLKTYLQAKDFSAKLHNVVDRVINEEYQRRQQEASTTISPGDAPKIC